MKVGRSKTEYMRLHEREIGEMMTMPEVEVVKVR